MTRIKFLEETEKRLKKRLKKQGVTITVSGLSGSGKSTAAKIIAKKLSVEYFYPASVFREKRSISLEEFVKKRGKEIDYMVDKKTLERGLRGNVVVDSRLGAWVLNSNADLKIFVECPLSLRAERVADREGITKEEALKKITERDKTDRGIYLKLYRIDMNDKSIYDVIIKNDGSVEELEKRIEEVLKRYGLCK